ncbi:MAG: hypothetical protein RLZZ383_320 [Pseudomonadota bacterium]
MRKQPLWIALAWMVACGGKDPDGDGIVGELDCDEDAATVATGLPEVCDGLDNDCDGLVDEDDADLTDGTVWYADADQDGVGAFNLGVACEAPPSAVTTAGDCDDANAAVGPDEEEVCDGIDNDCDALIDDADTLAPSAGWYVDVDGDGFGDDATVVLACDPPEGRIPTGGDCDDAAAGVNPTAIEVCDGVDNDCDGALDDADDGIDTSGLVTGFVDADGDGYGDDAQPVTTCALPSGVSAVGGDCDDANAAIAPLLEEACDGIDNDCDGRIDLDRWWDDRFAYRVPVTVTGPPSDLEAAPVSIDVDFESLLLAQGDASGLDESSVRLVRPDCAGDADIPVDFIDLATHLFDKGTTPSPAGDGVGALTFRYDTDGDFSTLETLAGGTSETYWVYFASNGSPSGVPRPAWSTGLVTSITGTAPDRIVSLRNAISAVDLDQSAGGLASSFGLRTGSNVGAQTTTAFGNGVFFNEVGGGPNGSWASATTEPATGLGLIERGSVVAVARAIGTVGNDFGSFDYTYYYFLFAGRPELYAKVTYTLASDSNIGPQGTLWAAAIRPWQIDNTDLVDGVSVGSRDEPLYRWAHGAYPTSDEGVFLGWRVAALGRGAPLSSPTGQYVTIAGQDVAALPVSAQITLPDGTNLLDGSTIMVWPHTGSRAGAEPAFLAALEGADAALGAAQRY